MLKVAPQRLLVFRHRHPIDPGTSCASLPPYCPFERADIDVMQQCREPCLARASGRLIHTPEVRQQGLPAQCPALRLFRRDPFLPLPFLHHLVSFGDFIDVGSEEAPIEGLASVRRSNGTCSFPAFRFHEWRREIRREGISETRLTILNSPKSRLVGYSFQP